MKRWNQVARKRKWIDLSSQLLLSPIFLLKQTRNHNLTTKEMWAHFTPSPALHCHITTMLLGYLHSPTSKPAYNTNNIQLFTHKHSPAVQTCWHKLQTGALGGLSPDRTRLSQLTSDCKLHLKQMQYLLQWLAAYQQPTTHRQIYFTKLFLSSLIWVCEDISL